MRANLNPCRTHARVIDRTAPFATAALYGSLALISAVVFGTLSIHPF